MNLRQTMHRDHALELRPIRDVEIRKENRCTPFVRTRCLCHCLVARTLRATPIASLCAELSPAHAYIGATYLGVGLPFRQGCLECLAAREVPRYAKAMQKKVARDCQPFSDKNTCMARQERLLRRLNAADGEDRCQPSWRLLFCKGHCLSNSTPDHTHAI